MAAHFRAAAQRSILKNTNRKENESLIFAEDFTPEERNALALGIINECDKTDLPKLPMEHWEIYDMWKRAKHPDKQVVILADMNECENRDIVRILGVYRKHSDPPLPRVKKSQRAVGIGENTKLMILKDYLGGDKISCIAKRYLVDQALVWRVIARLI